jgi:hypothetical protein
MPYDFVKIKETFHCFRAATSGQLVGELHQPIRSPGPFHDAELMEATEQINAILKGVSGNNRDERRKLSFIVFKDQLLLVWAEYGALSPYDEEATVARELGLSP